MQGYFNQKKIFVLRFHLCLWAETFVDLEKNRDLLFLGECFFHTTCYYKLHFSDHLFLWVNSTTAKSTKIGIK